MAVPSGGAIVKLTGRAAGWTGRRETARPTQVAARSAATTQGTTSRLLRTLSTGSVAARVAVGDPTQRLGDVRRALPAVVPVLGQAGTHQPIERRRCQRLSGHDRLRLVLQDGADEAGLARRCEGALSRRHLVQHQRQGPDVRADVRFLPLDLLGGHVRQRAEQGALTRQRLLGRGQRGQRARSARAVRAQLGQAEVEQLDARLRQHHVLWFQVAVDDSRAVGLVQGARDLDAVAEHLVDGKRALLQPLGERLAIDVFHDEVDDPVLLAHVVDRADVGMVQRGDGSRLALEPRAPLRIGHERRSHHLDRDRAIETCVPRAIDLAHPPRAERCCDFVGTEARAGNQWHRLCRDLRARTNHTPGVRSSREQVYHPQTM